MQRVKWILVPIASLSVALALVAGACTQQAATPVPASPSAMASAMASPSAMMESPSAMASAMASPSAMESAMQSASTTP